MNVNLNLINKYLCIPYEQFQEWMQLCIYFSINYDMPVI